ncbi:MAG: phosphopantothenoylcysteine decarboxylase [marine bacterium B5-7]|nr:MAG: phosphopantothenoylcysteine decarboxylase [marine bacterium B5-7]
MSTLKNKHIVLGVTGGIAAYKSAELVRLLIKAGAEVRVVMTTHACEFIQPLTFQTLTSHPVHTECADDDPMRHIELARWADLFVIAPTTANTFSKIAQGYADDLLSTLCLATNAPMILVPAMNQQMWQQAIIQENLQRLLDKSITVLMPDSGEQACGDMGPGRMQAPEAILQTVQQHFANKILQNKKILITAGPTREWIDPVRYISNASSGKMGWALAKAAEQLGASVSLIIGPNHLPALPNVHTQQVESAQDMYDTVMTQVDGCDWFIGAAAVSDYRPDTTALQKMKKQDQLKLTLNKAPDILHTVAKLPNRPLTIGFALETDNVLLHAKEKLRRKQLDFILANTLGSQQGFDSDYNEVSLINNSAQVIDAFSGLKQHIAYEILQRIYTYRKEIV